MSQESNNELIPRNGHTLLVGIGARISGCAKAKELKRTRLGEGIRGSEYTLA
jgi:hypothetical protein